MAAGYPPSPQPPEGAHPLDGIARLLLDLAAEEAEQEQQARAQSEPESGSDSC